jgi:hypothetical protein
MILGAMAQRSQSIRFDASLVRIGQSNIALLPASVSAKLPSRGQVAVRGSVNGAPFETVLEPDGRSDHWMKVEDRLKRAASLRVGESASFELEVAERWPEPRVPGDLAAALDEAPHAVRELWPAITPMARWEWVRWVNATRDPDTRRRRVDVMISKLERGKRRPCCFNLSSCTDPELSKRGVLITPAPSSVPGPAAR